MPCNLTPLTPLTLHSLFVHCRACLQGGVDTGFIAKHVEQLLAPQPVPREVLALAATAYLLISELTAEVRKAGGRAQGGAPGLPEARLAAAPPALQGGQSP